MPKCSICQRSFSQEWTKQRHEKLCKEKQEAIKRHPERYKGTHNKMW